MKKLSLLIFVLVVFIVSCEDDRLKLPQVIAEPNALALTSEEPSAEIVLGTNPSFVLNWEVTYKPEWLEITPLSGNVSGGTAINVTASSSTLFVGKQEDKITISTSTNQLEIPVTFDVTESTVIQLTPAELVFNYNENSKPATLENKSNKAVNWQLESSAFYLSITPNSGSLNIGQSINLTVTVNRSNLETKIYTESLKLKVDGALSFQAPVTILNYTETMLFLSSQVIDSEYDRTYDNLIMVSSENKLVRLHTETKEFSTLALPLAPTCVSVGMDGHYAVVGHDAWITLVDITTMKIEKSYPVSVDALDVVLAPNFWAYVFPKRDQWTYIRCINLQDGTDMPHTGMQIYAGTKAKLHPSGKYIYGANNGVSPSDAEKYDIQNGQASYLYDSPYHGTYEFYGDLWMADDGSKMFAKSLNSFRLSSDRNLDMIYGGSIPGNNVSIKTLDHITSKNRVCAVLNEYYTGTIKNEVRVFTGDFLNDLGTKPLPDFLVNTSEGYKMIPSEGHFGFFNSLGTKFFVVVKSGNNPGFPDQWAVATVNLN